MPYTVNQAIANAYFKARIRSRAFDPVSGSDISVGLDALNFLLADKTLDISEIPYYTTISFPLVSGQDTYFIPDLITISTLTFFVNGTSQTDVVRYSTNYQSRNEFFGSPRAMNIQSLPFNWHMERTFNTDPAVVPVNGTAPYIGGGANLYWYFVPDLAYPAQIWGLFRMKQVILGQDLTQTLDLFYIDFLEFQLAERLCAEFDFAVPVNVSQQLQKFYKILDKQSGQLDTKGIKITTLDNRNQTLNYAQVNLGHGWVP